MQIHDGNILLAGRGPLFVDVDVDVVGVGEFGAGVADVRVRDGEFEVADVFGAPVELGAFAFGDFRGAFGMANEGDELGDRFAAREVAGVASEEGTRICRGGEDGDGEAVGEKEEEEVLEGRGGSEYQRKHDDDFVLK